MPRMPDALQRKGYRPSREERAEAGLLTGSESPNSHPRSRPPSRADKRDPHQPPHAGGYAFDPPRCHSHILIAHQTGNILPEARDLRGRNVVAIPTVVDPGKLHDSG